MRFAVACLMAFAACALPSTDEFSSGSRDAGTGSSSSSSGGTEAGPGPGPGPADGGSSDAPPAEGGAPTGANLFANGDFENGTCGDVSFFQGEGGSSSTAHAGSFACQACRKNEGTDFYTINTRYLVKPPTVGEVYRATAWVKRGADSFKDQDIAIRIRTALDQPFTVVEETKSAVVTLGDDWQKLEVKTTIAKPADELDVFVGAETLTTAGQRCFILDDLEVVRE